jgi:hypothetical protein
MPLFRRLRSGERKDKKMGSREKDVRLEQRRQLEEKLKQRLSILTDRGVESGTIAKDTTVRQLRAKVREAGKRLKVIEGKEKKSEEMAKIKAEKLAAPKKEKAGKKKAAEEQEAESKRQQKKKKKKETKDKE